MDIKVQNTETRREPWRIEERRIFAVNCYRIDWWQTYPTRESALAEFAAVLSKAAKGYYDATVPQAADGHAPHADHRLVLVEDGAR